LQEENADQVAWLTEAHVDFAVTPYAEAWAKALSHMPAPTSADGRTDSLLLTPASHGTDGFFIAVLTRRT
jgi:16S rRNA (cytosine967-C5)-methyltransferase